MVQVPTVKCEELSQDVRLLEAARNGDEESVARLLEEGLPIDAADSDGITALIFAAMAGHLEIVRLLVKHGADTTIRDNLGYSAYKAAMLYGDFRGATMPPHDKILKYLQQFEADA